MVVNGGTITPDRVATHIGEQVTVCGKVYGTRLLDNGPIFLNTGEEYPNNPFTAVSCSTNGVTSPISQGSI